MQSYVTKRRLLSLKIIAFDFLLIHRQSNSLDFPRQENKNDTNSIQYDSQD